MDLCTRRFVLAFPLLAVACGSNNQTADAAPDVTADTAGEAGGEAGVPTWTASGLDGDIIDILVIDPKAPSTIFAGVPAAGLSPGLHRSRDGGRTWSLVPGLPAQSVQSLAVSPTQNIVLASVGISTYRSTDGGDSWTVTGNDPGALYTMIFAPNGSMVYSVISQTGMVVSTDGASWTNLPSMGLPPLNTVPLGPLAHDGSKLYLGSGGQGIYVSSDGGSTFAGPGSGLPQAFADSILALSATPTRPGVVLALTLSDGLYRSNDAAATWTKVNLSYARHSGLLFDRQQASRLYASQDETQGGPGGLARSLDDGQTWSAFGPSGLAVLAVDESLADGSLYVGTIGSGIWRFGF